MLQGLVGISKSIKIVGLSAGAPWSLGWLHASAVVEAGAGVVVVVVAVVVVVVVVPVDVGEPCESC